MLHKKILELRNKIGHKPIHFFNPSSKYEQNHSELQTRAPKNNNKDSERLIKQYFCIFGVPDDYGTVPVKGCFTKSIEERGPNSKASCKIVVLNQHDQKDPLCLPLVLQEDEIGLYAEYEPDPMPSGDRLLMQVREGTINNGSYGFNYVWDKMEYKEDTGLILMNESTLYEISPVTIGSQKETFVVRSADGHFIDQFLEEETEDFFKFVPRKHHLELRSIINRHITLAKMQPLETRQQSTTSNQAAAGKVIDYNYLINNLKL